MRFCVTTAWMLASGISLAASSTAVPGPARRKQSLQRVFVALVGIVATLYVAIVVFVYFRQEFLIFHPTPLPANYEFSMPGVSEDKISVAGAELSALHLRLPNPRGVVFFLHGNAGNVKSWFTSVEFYQRINYDLYIIDYRGFGKSTGTIESEAQLHADVRAAWDRVTPHYAGMKKVIYGRSLGTGLGAKLAADVQPDLTVLVSPYFSLLAMAELRYPWLPAALSRYAMRSDEWLPKIRHDVFVMHGDLDTVIPLAQGERLSKARAATAFLVVNGAGHNDIQRFPAYRDALANRLIGL